MCVIAKACAYLGRLSMSYSLAVSILTVSIPFTGIIIVWEGVKTLCFTHSLMRMMPV